MSYVELATEAIMKAYNGGSKSITPKKIHPDYENQKDVDVWEEINKVAYKLQEEGFVTVKKTVKSKSIFAQSDDIQKIVFVQENMADFAEKYGQKEKKAFFKELEEALIPYTESEHEQIAIFAKEQLEIVRSGKNPKYVQKVQNERVSMLETFAGAYKAGDLNMGAAESKVRGDIMHQRVEDTKNYWRMQPYMSPE